MANTDPTLLAQRLVTAAQRAGADAAEVMISHSDSTSVTWRAGALETLERAEDCEVGIRLLLDHRQAVVATTDVRERALEDLVTQAIDMVQRAPQDPFCGLAEDAWISKEVRKDIPLNDPKDVDSETLCAMARRAEEGACAVSGVTQCEETGASHGRGMVTPLSSNGFSHTWRQSGTSLYASALAGTGTEMVVDYHAKSRVFVADLPDPDAIGREAGERAVRGLGATKLTTGRCPIVFEPRVAASLIGHFLGAIMGSSIARGTSFLKDKLGQPVFPPSITIEEDPFRPRSAASRVVDVEGVAPRWRALVDKGVITTWLLECRSARQLGMVSTGHASRGCGDLPRPAVHALKVRGEGISPHDLIRDIKEGVYITELMGTGVNGVTGDYSRAARGLAIVNGELATPVHEITIAGNLNDMFATLRAADDCEDPPDLRAPTMRIESMMVAGV